MEAAWRVQVRRRAMNANEHFHNAYNGLQLAKALIEMLGTAQQGPLAWFAGSRLYHVLALERLTEAALNLSYAIVSMEEAENLALHGCSLDHPSLPLQVSRVMAGHARNCTEWCRGHLATQTTLTDSFHIFHTTQIARIQAEQTRAYHALTYAIEWTEAARGQVVIAQQFL